jgi:hypothetical protein
LRAGLFAGTLEPAQGGIEIFVLTNANAGHRNLVEGLVRSDRRWPWGRIAGKKDREF